MNKTEDTALDPYEVYDEIFKDMKFYVDENDTDNVYVEYKLSNGTYEFRHIKDGKFSAYIRSMYRDIANSNNVPSFQAVLQKYIDYALLTEPKVKILSRMGGTSNETAYFMADEKNTVLLINKCGTKRRSGADQYKFLKTPNMAKQLMPKKRGGLIEELSPFLNMNDNMKILFTVNLVQEFICTSSHFLCVISSQQGSGKSTFTNMWRRIVDPAIAVITTMPENSESLKNHLANNLMVCFDNTQQLNSTYSDILCGAVTGSSYTKRKLYTDNTEVIMKLHNIIILNGIDVIPQKSDLLERTLLFRLNKISDKNRKNEEEIEASFKSSLPYIMGAIFNTLSKYYKVKDNTQIVGSHRMAGAYKDCYIIAKLLDVEEQFLKAFHSNQLEMQNDYSETNPIISAITSFMDDIHRKQIKGSVSELYNEISEYADKRAFPKSPSAFSRELTKQQAALEQAGFRTALIKNRNNTSLTIRRKEQNNDI